MKDSFDLERARCDAKALLRAARAGDPEALPRMRPDREPCLADAQRAVALELGEPSWPALVRRASVPPLIRAAAEGRVRDVQLLLEQGAPAGARDPDTGGTALHVAALHGWVDTVGTLVEWIPLDRHALDDRGDTALGACAKGSVAAGGDHLLVAQVLLANGLRPDRAMARQATPELATLLRRWLTDPPEAVEPAPELAELAWRADAALFTYLAGSEVVQRHRVGDGFAFCTRLSRNDRNGVVCSRLTSQAADREIAEALSWLSGNGVSGQWLVRHDPAPPNLGARLERAGCRPERSAVFMAARLEAPMPTMVPDAVEIELIDDASTLAQALASGEAFPEADPGERDRELALLISLGLEPDRPLRHYVALHAGVAVGFASAFHSPPALLLDELAVAPTARRGGIGRALVLRALSDGSRAGCGAAVLAPTRGTRAFYERLGFVQGRYPMDRAFYTPHA
ncbi:MAG: GNAT family N-acetyltransferase [Solirubrobacteraceae bacterium]